ncbi:MAG TPA: tetratricopeptide repeat protein [Syntrophorhabdaceae bacterium]|nr:tetratricopeptide repeat protein [Syntrophorhabdaceae bacterium]
MSSDLTKLQNKVDVLTAEGRYREAIELLKKEADTPIDSTAVKAAILNELGGLCRAVGSYEESRDAFTRAMDILAESEGKDDPDYATTINNLAGTYRLMGDRKSAESLFIEAADVYARTLGREHFLYASAINNLGLLYQDMKEFDKAETLHREALEIVRKDERNPIAYATTLNNLAGPCRANGRNEEARNYAEEALDIYRNVLGEDHPLYASGLNNLASLYSLTNEYEKAEPLYLKALEICRRIFGKRHPDALAAAGNLILMYEKMGDKKKAELLKTQLDE